MANEVTITMNARDAEQVRAWMRTRQGIKETGEELDRVAAKGRKAGKDTEGGFASVLPTMGKVAASLTGVGTAVAGVLKFADLVKRQYEEMLAKQAEAAGAQLGISGQLRAATATFIGRPNAPSIADFHSRMVAGANGVDLGELYSSFTGAMGSAGDMSVQTVQQAALDSARLRPELNKEDRESLMRSSLMLTKEFKRPLAESMAAVIQAASQDATATLGDFAKNVVPTVVQARAFGGHKDSFESIMADVQGIGLVAGDPHGRRTSTAYLNALQTIKEETLKAGLVGPDASIAEQLAAARGSPKIQQLALGVFADSAGLDPKKALAAMRKNKLGKGELGGEARTFMAGVEFLQANQDPATNPFARERATAFGQNLGMTPKAVKAVEDLNKAFSASPVGQTDAIARAEKQFKTMTLFKQFDAAQESSTRTALADIRYRTGVDPLTRGTQFAAESILGVGAANDITFGTPQANRLMAVRQEAQLGLGRTSDPAVVEALRELIDQTNRQIELLRNPPVQKMEVINRTNQPANPPTAAGLAEQGIRRGNL
jgi:hypothetical protein